MRSFARFAPVLIVTVLVFVSIGRWPLWQDEAYTWVITRDTAERLVTATAGDRHPPLYYLCVWALRGFPDNDAIVRLPSALAIIAAVAVVAEAGRRWVSPRVGFIAALLIAVSPYALLYGNTARMYALLLFWGSLLLAAALAMVRGRAILGPTLLIFVASAGAIWTHYAGSVAIIGAGLALLAGLALRPESWRERLLRMVPALVAFVLAGVTFLPWARGPLLYQLSSKDAPADRTLAVLAYATWAFDSRVPLLSWVWMAAQAVGLVLALRRRDMVLLGFVVAGVAGPWVFSSSGPAQNPRNYSDLLPAAAILAASALVALEGRLRMRPHVLPLVIAAVAAEPVYDVLTRTVSPQESGIGFDYQIEGQVMDVSVPKNAALYFRPTYMETQYVRYAEGLSARKELPVDEHTWLAAARAEFVDSAVAARFVAHCTFKSAFRVILYAPEGPGCEAVLRWVAEVADDREYAPFLMELGRRALDEGRINEAIAYGERVKAVTRGHPGADILLVEAKLRQSDTAGALAAADDALAIAKRWHWPGATMGEIHTWAARAHEMDQHAMERAAALQAAKCTRTAVFPSWCGTFFETALPIFGFVAPPMPQVRALPALAESQLPALPDHPPPDAERVALWPLDGEVLPEDWVDGGGSVWMDEAEGVVSLGLAAVPGAPMGMACAPLVPASPRMAIRLRWSYTPTVEESRTKILLEARMMDAQGRAMQSGWSQIREEIIKFIEPVKWRVDRYDFRPHVRAAQVRFCAIVDGPAPARGKIDWIEVLQVKQ